MVDDPSAALLIRVWLEGPGELRARLLTLRGAAAGTRQPEPVRWAGRAARSRVYPRLRAPPSALPDAPRWRRAAFPIFDVHTHHVVPDGPWRENAMRIASMVA